MIDREPGARVVGLHIPLAWFLQWELPRHLVDRVLGFDVLIDRSGQQPCSDLDLFRNWVKLAHDHGRDGRDIILLEVRGRLWRMALDLKEETPNASGNAKRPLAPGVFESAVEYVAAHYREPIRISQVAKTAGVSRNHIMRLFRQVTGWTINEYVTHLRLSHAQRLLVTTDLKVIDIMYDSGFSSPNRFYTAFKEQTHTTPARYRRRFG